MKKLLLLFCAAVSFIIFSCKNHSGKSAADMINEASRNPNINVSNQKYAVNVLPGWRETDTVLNGLKAHMIYAPDNADKTTHANINILNESMQGYDLEDYTKANLSSMAAALPSFKKIDQGNIETSAGNEGVWIHSTYNVSGLNIEGIEYIIPINGIAYILTGTANGGELSKYRNDFDNIVKSFHIN